MKLKLHWQILIAMASGALIGVFFNVIHDGDPRRIIFQLIVMLGSIFIRLLKMVIIPLVFFSIVSGVASVGKGRGIGRLGLKTFAYYLVSSLIAILIGLFMANLIQPGLGADIIDNANFDQSAIQAPDSIGEILLKMIPLNPVEAAASGHMLGIIFFSIFLGVAITMVGHQTGHFLRRIFGAGFEVMMKITELVIKIAPLGVFGLVAETVAGAGIGVFKSMGLYIATILGGFSLHLFVVLPLLFYLLVRENPLYHFRAMLPAMLTAFSTCSSNATLPVTMNNVEKNAGISNRVSSFVLPMGATVNMNGTALYECAGVIFISQVLGIGLDLSQQFTVALTALLSAVGAAGIPAAGVVVIFIVTQAIGFTDAQVGVIIGMMLAVDRPIDMFRTTLNIFSDSVGAVIIARSEGERGLYRGWKK